MQNLNPDEVKRLIDLLECKVDIVYFLKNYIVIEEPGGVVPFNPYPKQIELAKAIIEDHYVVVLKSRQIGISTLVQAVCVYLLTFYRNVTIGVISRDGPEATDFVRKTRIMYEHLPLRLRFNYIKKTEQSFELSNNSRIIASTVNLSNPSSVFRGKTITLLIIDEAAYIRKIEEAFRGMSAATLRAHEVAKQKGIPYGIVVLSTPDKTTGTGEWFYRLWTESCAGLSGFKPIKIHYSEAPFTTDEWLRKQKQILLSAGGGQDAIDRELELKFTSSADSMFTKEVFEVLQSIVEAPSNPVVIERRYFSNRGLFVGSGKWEFYDTISKDKVYLVGVDVAPSYGACLSAIEVFEYPNLSQVAEFSGKLRISDLMKEILFIMQQTDRSLLIVESNSYAAKLVEDLEEHPLTESRMFKTKKFKQGKGGRLVVTDVKPGLYTDSVTKPKMMQALYEYVSEKPHMIKSKQLALELMGIDKTYHSKRLTDRAMSLAFICYVVKYHPSDIPEPFEVVGEQSDVVNDLIEITHNLSRPHTPWSYVQEKLTNTNVQDNAFEDFMLGTEQDTESLEDRVKITPLTSWWKETI